MKRIISLFISIALVVSLTACGAATEQPVNEEAASVTTETVEEKEAEAVEEEPEEAEDEGPATMVNMLANGDFSAETAHWGTYTAQMGSCTFGAPGGKGKMTINNVGKVNYSCQLYYDGFELVQGGLYELSFDMSSTIPRNIEARIQINGSDYHAYTQASVDITEEMEHYSFEFTMEEGYDPSPRLCFNMGIPEGVEEMEKHVIELDNVSLMLLDSSGMQEVEVVDYSMPVNVNQVGFLPDARKTAVVREPEDSMSYDIIDVNSGDKVYSGQVSETVDAKEAREKVASIDFSDYREAGTYKIVLSNGGESHPFTIGEDVYDELLLKSFLFLYTQRCGMEITEELAGEFAHPECHNTKARIYGTDKYKEVYGGWHDAGDYGRYVVPGAVTVADLFLSYEDNADIWNGVMGDSVGIPESGNGIPDILDEARYELDWMLMMQDDSTGGVYHKISCLEFPGFVMPEEETEELVLAPISNTATGDFAAIMAKASMVYADIDSEFANKCLKAAVKAWKYLAAIPKSIGYTNPEDILTGEYPDLRDQDERLWAAVELYAATAETEYKDHIAMMFDRYVKHGYGWADNYSYANMDYLKLSDNLIDSRIAELIKAGVKEEADIYLDNVNKDGYRCSLGKNYCWGSNMVVSNNARIMLDAYKVTGDDNYFNAAYDQLSYLLGQNTLSYCFLTGFGTVSPEHSHHRPSMATGYVLPGMVAGGPDSSLEDPLTKATMGDVAPAKCYIDNDQSYSTNEVTIYWNSPFIYLLSYEMMNN